MRMSRAEEAATLDAACRAGLTPGAIRRRAGGGRARAVRRSNRADHIAALIASSGELSTLSRNIRHLTRLLREGNVRAALEYRDMLATLDGDIRGHLTLASAVLADLRPRRPTSVASKHSTGDVPENSMTQAPHIDGVLIQWGDRLFYPGNRMVKTLPLPKLGRSQQGNGPRPFGGASRRRLCAGFLR